MDNMHNEAQIIFRTGPLALVEFLLDRWDQNWPSLTVSDTYVGLFRTLVQDITDSNAFDSALRPRDDALIGIPDNVDPRTMSLGSLFIHGAIMALSIQHRGYVEPDRLISLLLELLELKPQFRVERHYDRVRFTGRQPFRIADGLSLDFDVRVPKARFF